MAEYNDQDKSLKLRKRNYLENSACKVGERVFLLL